MRKKINIKDTKCAAGINQWRRDIGADTSLVTFSTREIAAAFKKYGYPTTYRFIQACIKENIFTKVSHGVYAFSVVGNNTIHYQRVVNAYKRYLNMLPHNKTPQVSKEDEITAAIKLLKDNGFTVLKLY